MPRPLCLSNSNSYQHFPCLILSPMRNLALPLTFKFASFVNQQQLFSKHLWVFKAEKTSYPLRSCGFPFTGLVIVFESSCRTRAQFLVLVLLGSVSTLLCNFHSRFLWDSVVEKDKVPESASCIRGEGSYLIPISLSVFTNSLNH